MQPVDNFLKAVESRLRCPVERRPAVMEELRGHLADRVEALTSQGANQEEAEKRAVREMEPAWLLALRLSKANGWNVPAFILRNIWAIGITAPLVIMCAFEQNSIFMNNLVRFGNLSSSSLLYLFLAYCMICCSIWLFGYGMGRVVRSWLWAMIPTALILYIGVICVLLNTNSLYVGSLLFTAISFQFFVIRGSKKASPNLAWLSWAGAGLLLMCTIFFNISDFMLLESNGLGKAILQYFSFGFLRNIRGLYRIPEFSPFIHFGFFAWACWLAAWVIERAERTTLVDAAE